MSLEPTAIDLTASPLTLPCGLTLPNWLVKCRMQETCASPPTYDPPVAKWRQIYDTWSGAKFGMLLTGQVQVDLRFLPIPGDVCVHPGSFHEACYVEVERVGQHSTAARWTVCGSNSASWQDVTCWSWKQTG